MVHSTGLVQMMQVNDNQNNSQNYLYSLTIKELKRDNS